MSIRHWRSNYAAKGAVWLSVYLPQTLTINVQISPKSTFLIQYYCLKITTINEKESGEKQWTKNKYLDYTLVISYNNCSELWTIGCSKRKEEEDFNVA